MKTQMKWISAEDRLPANDDFVCVVLDWSGYSTEMEPETVYICQYVKEDDVWFDGECVFDNVSYWSKTFPKAPKHKNTEVEWIHVNDKLPAKGDEVMIAEGDGSIGMGTLDNDGEIYIWQNIPDGIANCVIHWAKPPLTPNELALIN